MNRRPQLPKQIQEQIVQAAAKARPYWETENYKQALVHMHEAWDLIPEPKVSWDYFAQSFSSTFVKAYIKIQDFKKAEAWVKTVREAYDVPHRGEDPTVDFIEAEYLFHAGQKDEAFKIFDSLYKQYKKRPFQEEDKALWEFYKTKAGIK